MSERLRVGVLANPMLTRFEEEALENVATLDGVTIDEVVVDGSVTEGSALAAGADAVNQGTSISLADLKLFVDVVRESGLKAFIHGDEKLGWLLGETEQMDWLQSRPVTEVDCLREASIRECEPVSAGGAWNTLPDDVTSDLGDSCDVVIRFGFGLLKGPILDAPEHGVLSVHTSDIREYRGMGHKISFVNDDPSAAITLQQLSEEIDGGRIVTVMSRELPPTPTLDDVWDAVYALQTEIFAAGIEQLQAGDSPSQPDELGPYYPHSLQQRNPRFVARLLAKNNWRRLQKRLS
ncbi:methionyl-tRNA formyltransferase-like protein [Halococcus thailandensis]|uniref:Methionyl-tRNA formyltransferase-like protein n=1 Tax=Halococcus thailandensis JCM 13552 TaxID=1227457 RepID=M0MYP7_9EURY|nr:methionyl-tRNA formyltransferase-like protein [Halococcus thailandensis]EMA49505.1 methionyl-tRNA formyltransferase-like protein [Halococcus thailandensis JCM 13552]